MSARRRLSWVETWMGVAAVIAQRSNCARSQIGAVIVSKDNRILATGYNGPPATMASEKTVGQHVICEFDCPRAMVNRPTAEYGDCIAIHAEMNALLFVDRRDSEDGTMYVNRVPCLNCQKAIANSGLRSVVMRDCHDEHLPYADAYRFFQRCGIRVELLP